MKPIKVFSHKSPDTDATGSAILWAWYLNNVASQEAEAYVLGDLNKETQFVLDTWKISSPAVLSGLEKGDRVTIVDTNNPQELPDNINEAEIIQIIDHHKLVGGLVTANPVEITMRPLACTATVIHDLMGESASGMPDAMKGLMLSCILSDTLEFRSPTTTPHDKAVAEKLAGELSINISEYASKMFEAKSDVSDFSDAQLLTLDAKKYEVAGKNFLISSLETTNPASILARKEALIAAMPGVAQAEGVEDVLFFVVDILKEEATVFLHNDLAKQMIKASFGSDVSADTVVLPGVVSRKKQIIPVLKM